ALNSLKKARLTRGISGLLILLLMGYFHGLPLTLKCPYPAIGDIQQAITSIVQNLYRMQQMKLVNIPRCGIKTIRVNGNIWSISETGMLRSLFKGRPIRLQSQNSKQLFILIQEV